MIGKRTVFERVCFFSMANYSNTGSGVGAPPPPHLCVEAGGGGEFATVVKGIS